MGVVFINHVDLSTISTSVMLFIMS